MHFTTVAFTTLLASASASAIPALPTVDKLTKRAEGTWDPKGNIKLTFSTETVKVGELNVDAIIAAVAPICHETGQCETNPIELKTQLASADTLTDLTVSIGPDGSYPTWIRNGLIDALAAAAKSVAKCTDGTYTNHCGGNAAAYCPAKQTKYTDCEVPKYWGINYQDPSEANAAPPNLGFDITVTEASNADLCTGIITGLGGVAGAVNGVAGGIFTLLSFACTSA